MKVYSQNRTKLCELIGGVILTYINCESIAAMLVDEITKTDNGDKIFHYEKTSKVKIEKYIAYLVKANKRGTTQSPTILEIINWIRNLDTLRVMRNGVVHSTWSPRPRVEGFTRLTFKQIQGKRKSQIKIVKVSELRNLLKKIELHFINGTALLASEFKEE